ncbi:MAG: glycosyltransferase family 4 protein [Candidatus Aenigmarchaeota archaeon]|nr:glycosyltransferase family 4 protein [Candidatus Aenigmarchaeota archaeon]
MKILHVTNHFHPCVGGIERHVLDLCIQLRKRGHTSDVLCLNRCPDGNHLPCEGEHQGIKISRVPFLDLKYYKVGRGVLSKLKGYDVVHVHGMGYFLDMIAATKCIHRKRIILSTHGGFFHTKKLGLLKRLHFQTAARLSLQAVERVVAVSRQDFERFSCVSGRVEHIPNGIDSQQFRVGKKCGKGIVSVGRFAPNKRIDLLVKTFRRVAEMDKGVRLTIVGGGEIGQLRGMVEGFEDNIVFAGDVSQEEKFGLLANAGFFASASEYEGFGISVLEGMASGCVPLVSPLPTYNDILNGKGFLVDYRNPEKAAGQILEILGKDMTLLRKRAREEARKYDWPHVMEKWESVYSL